MATPAAVVARDINFLRLEVDAGSPEGGRALFEKLTQDVVSVANRNARHLEANGGDWGIDTYVGELDGGELAVWQAKYFPRGVGESQQAQIRASLTSVLKHAGEKGFTVAAWTLCLPCDLDPEAAVWWERFKKKEAARLGIEINLWNESALRTRLMSADCADISRCYFGPHVPASPPPLPTKELPDPQMYDHALFITQLQQAGVTENASAKQAFFNAELLSREVGDKDVTEEVQELRQRRAEVHAIWETRFNGHDARDADDKLPGLHPDVMQAVEGHHHATPPRHLRAGLIHTLGLMHQQVEERRAGWTRTWRQTAEAFDA